jgi:hypothetical protein
MSSKIKLSRGSYNERLELEVNKFIENKEVIGVSIASMQPSYSEIVVTYKE